MVHRNRRSVLAGGATLLSGSILVSSGAVGSETESDGEESASEEGVVIDIQEGWTDGADSVRIGQTSNLSTDLCLRNYGDETVTAPLELEIGYIDEEIDTFEIGAGESEDEKIGYPHPVSLGPGEHDWTIRAGEATETGTLVVEADDDYEDREDGFYIVNFEYRNVDGNTLVRTLSPSDDEVDFWFTFEVVNYRHEPVEEELVFTVDGETQRWGPLEFEPQGYKQAYFVFDLHETGEYEWTASIGDDSISGDIQIVPGEDDSDGEEEEYCP